MTNLEKIGLEAIHANLMEAKTAIGVYLRSLMLRSEPLKLGETGL